MEKALERFFQKVQEDDNGCWIWTASRSQFGHGKFKFERKSWSAHKWLWVCWNGDVPEGFILCHAPQLCHNAACVNPDHIILGTYSDNQTHRVLDGTDNRGVKSHNVLLTEKQVLDIRKRTSEPLKDLGEEYGVCVSTISKIRSRHLWKHL